MPYVADLQLAISGYPAQNQITGIIDTGTGPGRAAFVQVKGVGPGGVAPTPPTSVTIGGIALTKTDETTAGSTFTQRWVGVSDTIPSGAQTALVAFTGSAISILEVCIVTLSGAQSVRSANVSNAASNGTAAWASTAQATLAGDLLIGMLKVDIGATAPVASGASGTVVRSNKPTGFSTNRVIVFDKPAAGASTGVNLTFSPNCFPVFDTVWAVQPLPANTGPAGTVTFDDLDAAGQFSSAAPDNLTGSITFEDLSPAGQFSTQPQASLAGAVAFEDVAVTGTLANQQGRLVSDTWKNAAGSPIPPNTVIPWVSVLRASDLQQILRLPNLALSSTSQADITSPTILPGQGYMLASVDGAGPLPLAKGFEPIMAVPA